MEFQTIEARSEEVEAVDQSQEVVELSTELLGQIGGGGAGGTIL
jgi:hypothetical protein